MDMLSISQIVTVLAKDLNKCFLTAKLPVVQSHSILMGGNFEQLWLCLFGRNACEMNWCFCIWKKMCSGLSL